MEQKSIKETLAGLAAKFDRTPEMSNRSDVIFFNEIKREAVIELLDAAHSAIQENQESAAWSYLVQASEHLGHLIGINEAESLTTPEQAINSKLEQYGRKGGLKKGENAKQLQDAVARKLIAATPKNGWKSRPEVHRQFFELADEISGFNATDYQWRALLKRPDIKKVLPPTSRRTR
ncbi:hypothetical protein [Stutzerimonas kunmingensis]|uniref:hypothetical protein n=1 Tax=Stutzerimonas kunmingensis TaxID=1211807 RepID=UPI0028AF035B|nr:hypothetical protein [Stutzerimonas kunmingensis]